MTAERQWAWIYDDLLKYQVELSHDLEQMFFKSTPQWESAKTVLDFGSGNGYYAKLLARICPEKEYTCAEINKELSSIAERNNYNKNIKIVNGSFEALGEGNCFDFVYCRHVLSYLKDDELARFIDWLGHNTSRHSAVLVIDADDQAFFTTPSLPMLEGGIERFKEELEEKGGNRSLKDVIGGKLVTAGFSHLSTRPLVVHSAISGRKYLMAMFMKAVAEIDHGSPLPLALRDEIDSWSSNKNSYLQYGIFGSIFAKER